MRISLPSNGVLGLREVELSMPKYKHLRALSEVNYTEEEIGYEFIKLLMTNPDDMEKITYRDKEYLLAIAVSALHMNNIPLTVTCACGAKHQALYQIKDQECFELEEGTPRSIEKSIGGKKFSFNVISAKDQNTIVQLARLNSKDEKDFRRHYEELFVCKTFGFDLNQEGIDKTMDMPITVYYSAMLFHEMLYHGVSTMVRTTCPKCHKPLVVGVPLAASLMHWSSADIMNDYVRVAKIAGGYQSFLDLTMAEMEQMVANLESGAV